MSFIPLPTNRLINYGIIVILVLWAFSPSVRHMPRGDQVAYLAETATKHTPAELIFNTCDLNRTRVYAPGDEKLFRPLLYIFLGAEHYFFGYNFTLWQIVGIFLHLVVSWLLLGLLWRISPGPFALLFTAWFAVLAVGQEMVIWHHINAYMIFFALMLTGFDRAYRILVEKDDRSANYMVIAGTSFLAIWIFELALIWAVVLAGVLWSESSAARRPYLVVMLLMPVVYGLLSYGLYIARGITDYPIHTGQAEPAGWEVIFSPVLSLIWWVYYGLFPARDQFLLSGRTMIVPAPGNGFLLWHWANWIIWPGTVLGIFVIVWIRRGLTKLRTGIGSWLFLLAGALLSFVLVIVIGRGVHRGLQDVLRLDLYYAYIAWGLIIALVYALVGPLLHKVVPFWERCVAGVCLVSLIAFNASLTRQIGLEWADISRPSLQCVRKIERFIRAHTDSSGLTFYIADDASGNRNYPAIVKRGEWPVENKVFVELLFPQYYRRMDAEYILY